MKASYLLTGGALLLALAGCSEGKAESGANVSRAFQVGGFTGIEVAGPFDVIVSTGKPAAVRVEGPQKLVDAMEVVVEGNKLKIRPKRKGWLNGFQYNGRPAKVTVSAPTLTAAEVAGSGDIVIDKVSGERFAGAIAGSGDLNVGQVAVNQLALTIAGSGGVKASGSAKRASYSIAGSGDLDAGNLTATDADAEIAGSGSIRARVTGTAKASIAGSGDIDISGGARCTQSKHGSGSIRCS
jgi:hypothetical protein